MFQDLPIPSQPQVTSTFEEEQKQFALEFNKYAQFLNSKLTRSHNGKKIVSVQTHERSEVVEPIRIQKKTPTPEEEMGPVFEKLPGETDDECIDRWRSQFLTTKNCPKRIILTNEPTACEATGGLPSCPSVVKARNVEKMQEEPLEVDQEDTLIGRFMPFIKRSEIQNQDLDIPELMQVD